MTLAVLTLAALPPAPPAAWPLQPRPEIVRGFELPAKPWLPGHRGVDLAGRVGQPVLAASPGQVTYAGPLAGRGVVTITTGPRRTTYEPVVPEVAVGATVTTGTVIGRLSAAGSHCLPRACLHWGLLHGKRYLNPLTLLPRRPIRLLPLTAQPAVNSVGNPADKPAGDPPDGSRRAAKLVIAATAALTLTAGLLIRRE
ncbi:M23 family metallopeptidase [Kribbella sp. NPDC051936]|uniref:murein hydrolase activator EnvC family protein n=1 Tax=Kribbella sp. NPDC051936 TaxID=3154946 RepID=UPI003428FC7E